jgi:hypothetical protein
MVRWPALVEERLVEVKMVSVSVAEEIEILPLESLGG